DDEVDDEELKLEGPTTIFNREPQRFRFSTRKGSMDVRPCFHNLRDAGFYDQILTLQPITATSDPLVTKAEIIERDAFEEMSVCEIHNKMRDLACLVIFDSNHKDRGFTRKEMAKVCRIDKPTTIHVSYKI
ncbi:hypothetical protein H0H93_001200, partial [Arthromyces matolae]